MTPFYEPGIYGGKIISQHLGAASTGTTQIVIGFTILGKVDPLDPSTLIEVARQDRTYYRAITDKTIDYVMLDLERLGFTGNGFEEIDQDNPKFFNLIGKEFDFKCEHRPAPKGGGLKEEWSLSRGPAEVKPQEASKVRELNALFGKQLKSLNARVSQPAKTAATKPADEPQPVGAGNGKTTPAEDDIPF